MIKVRIAPSPTGDPHVGTAYSALFNWAFARRHGGVFILRIEDTDRTRSTPESEKAILESLKWLGLDWDEGPEKGGPGAPYRQSERSEIYRKYVEELVTAGKAYPCFCTAERLAELRASGKSQGYDGCCRDLSSGEARARIDAGETHVVRLRVEKEKITSFRDEIRGTVTFDNSTVDDQVLMKSDGFPTYHLANVVDDHLMGITQVIRAEEWISSTPKHVMLYEAFGWEQPLFIHLPLLRNKNKSKISKRKNPTSILYYKEKGYLPEALLNFLALMGWTMSDGEEVFSIDRLASELVASKIHTGSPVFDLEKLDWLNGIYIRQLSISDLADRVVDGHLGGLDVGREDVAKVLPLVQERMKVLGDFAEKADFFFNEIPVTPESFKKAKLPAADLASILEKTCPLIESTGLDDQDDVENRLRSLSDSEGVKVGKLFMAIRIAVTGKSATPPLLDSMAVLGVEECAGRIRKAVAVLKG
jgi:glutamyl-tRNA synthetase